MDLDLSDRTAVVTGSTAGIGYAIARELASQGARVVLTGRTDSGVREAVARLGAEVEDDRIEGVAADLGTAAGADRLITAVPECDVLVNNVGVLEPKEFADIGDADWQRFFDVNVMSGVRATRHYLHGMLRRDWGRIVFIASESAIHIPAEMIHYGVTKSAQLGLARGVAELTAATNVTCNSVLPGPTWSRGVGDFIRHTAEDRGEDIETVEREFFQKARPTSLIQRFARVEEIASMVAYVCSPAASASNGAALRVDGGCVRTIV